MEEEKSQYEVEKLETSQLPLTSAEDQPPLVVDLPDGQKLMIGKLDPGTVIEVATWRGTGRPDSRTNRIMLGMSSADEYNDETAELKDVVKKRRLFSRKSVPLEVDNVGQNNELVAHEKALEINAVKVEYVATPVKTGINHDLLNPGSRATIQEVHREEIEKVKSPLKAPRWIVTTVSIVLVFGVLGGPLGISIAHPKSGVGTSIGSAQSSLIIYKRSHEASVGEKVISDISIPKSSPSLGVVSAKSEGHYLLGTNIGYQQASTSQLKGKVLLVFPFVGSLIGIFDK